VGGSEKAPFFIYIDGGFMAKKKEAKATKKAEKKTPAKKVKKAAKSK
jgi:predicted peroxiredoxin